MSYSDELSFGGYCGMPLTQLLFVDPDYFFWAYEKGVLSRGALCVHAPRLHARATRIRIGREPLGTLAAEYAISGGRLQGVSIVPASSFRDFNAVRRSWLDLSFARSLHAGKDKAGAKLLVRAVKEVWFGDPSARMSQEKCRDFFAREEHFVLDAGPIPG